MKIGGIKVSKNEPILVLPRSEGDDIPFRAKAVAINDEFDALVPVPVPPMVITKEGKQPDYTDKNYKVAMAARNDKRFAFLCLSSLEPSNIEWTGVDMEKPNTWCGWTDELMAAGLAEAECNRIVNLVMIANSLDESKIEEARKAFLLGQVE
jgi:hypothetical protein